MKKAFMGIVLGALCLGSVFAGAATLSADAIRVVTPRVIADVQPGTATEVYMELDNISKTPKTIIAAVSPIANQTQLHRVIVQSGQSIMQQVPSITVAAKRSRNLKPGGFHVMLMGLKKSLPAGTHLPITLVFKDGSTLIVNATVKNGTV